MSTITDNTLLFWTLTKGGCLGVDFVRRWFWGSMESLRFEKTDMMKALVSSSTDYRTEQVAGLSNRTMTPSTVNWFAFSFSY